VARAEWAAGDERLLVGREESLGRDVWVHVHHRDAPALAWDAYEKPPAASLLATCRGRRLAWPETRQILQQVLHAVEADLARDPDRPVSVGHAFLDTSGAVRLLPFAVEPPREGAGAPGRRPLREWSLLLRRAEVLCLTGDPAARDVDVPLAEHARGLLDELAVGAADAAAIQRIGERLEAMADWPAEVRPRGDLALVGCGAVALLLVSAGMAADPTDRPEGLVTGHASALACGLVALAFAFALRGTAFLRFSGVAVATRAGPASRWRCFARAALGWSPTLLAGLLAAGLGWADPDAGSRAWVLVGRHGLQLLGLLAAVVTPARRPNDRLAGTHLVAD
jgi:hypothetical protein